MSQDLHISGERLSARLMEMAQIGATPKGGVCRVALSDEDQADQDLFIQWCRGAGCTATVDQIGNIFTQRAGSDKDLPAIIAGSHLDSQPTGGKMESECRAAGIEGRLEVWHMPPVTFAAECISAAANNLGYASMEMISGAGHDAMYLTQIVSTGMIFVPCENGLSHNELENTQPEDLVAGGNVLLTALLGWQTPRRTESEIFVFHQ